MRGYQLFSSNGLNPNIYRGRFTWVHRLTDLGAFSLSFIASPMRQNSLEKWHRGNLIALASRERIPGRVGWRLRRCRRPPVTHFPSWASSSRFLLPHNNLVWQMQRLQDPVPPESPTFKILLVSGGQAFSIWVFGECVTSKLQPSGHGQYEHVNLKIHRKRTFTVSTLVRLINVVQVHPSSLCYLAGLALF